MGFTPEEQPSARTIANRLNAQKSTGPKTEEGKRRSSQNAMKHGLTAATHMQTVFDEGQDFEDFQEGLLDHFQPRTVYERVLVDRIITLMWRLKRVPVIESAMMRTKLAKRETNPPSMAFQRDHGALEFLHLSRYEANLDRCLHRTLKDLKEAREESLQNKPNDVPNRGTSRRELPREAHPPVAKPGLQLAIGREIHNHGPDPSSTGR